MEWLLTCVRPPPLPHTKIHRGWMHGSHTPTHWKQMHSDHGLWPMGFATTRTWGACSGQRGRPSIPFVRTVGLEYF